LALTAPRVSGDTQFSNIGSSKAAPIGRTLSRSLSSATARPARKQQPDSKLAGVEFHGLKLTQAGSEGLSLFLTIAAAANVLRKFVVSHGSNWMTISF
jgi:hypothetical protein